MKNQLIQSVTLIVSIVTFTACFKDNNRTDESESGLSVVDIATPTKKDLEASYGAECAGVKLSAETLAKVSGKSGCDALLALTNEYRLSIEGGACEDGSKGTDLPAATGQLNSQSIQTSLKQNCDYSVKLELGLGGIYYFDNSKSWRNNLKRANVKGPTADLTIRLSPTGAGQQAGLPPSSEVESTGFTNLKIRVNFATDKENPGTGGNTGPNPQNPGVRPEFKVPENWNGMTFQGDSLFNLRKLN